MLAPRDPLPALDQSGSPLSDQAGGEGANAAPGHADPLIVETQNLGDASGPGSSPPVEPEDGLAAPHSIPIAEEPEHLPLSGRPNNQWEYGINYGARRVRGFMCRVDYEFELGHASDGNKIYPCLDTLRRERACVSGCGIVEVEVTLYRVIDWGRDDLDGQEPAQCDRSPEGGDAIGGSVEDESAVAGGDAPVSTLGEGLQTLVPASDPPAGSLSLSDDQRPVPPDANDNLGGLPWI